MEALERYPLEHITWGVLTLSPKVRQALPLHAQYRGLVDRWGKLAKYIRRTWGDFEYHWSLEQHGDGVPHVNLILVSEAIAHQLRARPPTATDKAQGIAPHWWRDLTTHCGFGWRVSLNHVVGRHEVAAYCTKMEKGAVKAPHALGAEVVKLSQLPVAAPKRTRRIRSSKGFLPPLRKDPAISGELRRTPLPQKMREEHHNGTVRLLEALQLGDNLGRMAPTEQGEWGAQRRDIEEEAAAWARWWRFMMPEAPSATVHSAAEETSAPPMPAREGEREREVFRRAARGNADTWLPAPAALKEAVKQTGPPGEDGEEQPFKPPEGEPFAEVKERMRERRALRERFDRHQDLIDAAYAALNEEQRAGAVSVRVVDGRLVVSTLLSGSDDQPAPEVAH
jgi:hypothetical protein